MHGRLIYRRPGRRAGLHNARHLFAITTHMNNIHPIDRFIRLLLAVVLFEAAFFWLATPWSWAAYAAGGVMLLTGALRSCPLYSLLGVPACGAKPACRLCRIAAVLALAVAVVGGSYASHVLTRKQFLADYNAMNGFYKQTLFLTGKGQRPEALAQYQQLLPAFAAFESRYTAYQPFALRQDEQLAADLRQVAQMIQSVGALVREGDLQQAHLDLERVRPVFQAMLKRNGVSMLAVALVDFHDAMETVLEAAAAQDAARILALYPSVSDTLNAVESAQNDEAIQAIRSALEQVKRSAEQGASDLDAPAQALKSRFVKVYLSRG